MTHQTAIANLKCTALNLLYKILLKERGGICTNEDISWLKSKIKYIYNHLFTSCAEQKSLCHADDLNTLEQCSVNTLNCSNIINMPQPITYTYLSVVPIKYLFELPLQTNVTYMWTTNSPGFLLNSNLNMCTAQTISGIDACGQPITINCLVRESTYGCTLFKSLTLGITC